jgi:hypothetical protein
MFCNHRKKSSAIPRRVSKGVKTETLSALSLRTVRLQRVGNKLICGCYAFNAASCEIADHEFIKLCFVLDSQLVTDINIRTDGGAKNQQSESQGENLQSDN